MAIKLVTNSIIFIVTVISGIWLSKLGKPYKPLVFNIHKFIALAFIIYAILISRGIYKTIQMNPLLWILLILSGIFILLALISGGILSAKEELLNSISLTHKLSSTLALFSIIGWYYFSLK